MLLRLCYAVSGTGIRCAAVHCAVLTDTMLLRYDATRCAVLTVGMLLPGAVRARGVRGATRAVQLDPQGPVLPPLPPTRSALPYSRYCPRYPLRVAPCSTLGTAPATP
eukprot:1274377-Rhodomonas_salina.1